MEAIVGLLSTILVPGAPHGDKHVGVLSYVNGSALQHHYHLVVRSNGLVKKVVARWFMPNKAAAI
jgi:hypothetical protein